MQIVSKRLGAIVLGACLLVALAFGGFTAFAAVTWQGSGFSNSLTVEATNNDEMKADIDKANVVVDVYRVATAKKNGTYDVYDYTLVDDFKNLKVPKSKDGSTVDISKLDNDGWQKLADDAAKEVGQASSGSGIDHVTVDAGTKLDTIDNGLYLLMAHGKDVPVTYDEDGAAELHAYSEIYDYEFEPVLVAVPNKAADEQGKIGTAQSYGAWLTDVTVTLKPERGPQYGSIKIIKSLDKPVNEPRSFVFHLVGEKPDGGTYDNYAEVHFESGQENETIVTHIPVGTKITVTEESTSGTGYKLSVGDTSEKTIVADRVVNDKDSGVEMVSVLFVNTPDGRFEHGYGIENKFVLSEAIGEGESSWDWKFIPVQDQYVEDAPEQS